MRKFRVVKSDKIRFVAIASEEEAKIWPPNGYDVIAANAAR